MKSTHQAAAVVMQTLAEAGFEAFLVGGCVRDQVMGQVPKDFDVTTDATPQEVMELFAHTIPVGVSFGVVRVLVGLEEVEVATFRADGEYTDGRRPDTVEFSTTVQEDVSRRDFTINGLVQKANGEVKDFVGGLEDLQNHLVRCIGDPARRFNEDSLRMLRAVRFAARFGFKIEFNTLAAITERADTLSRVSQERITDELLKMFSGPRPGVALRLLAETTLLFQVFPELRLTSAQNGLLTPEDMEEAPIARFNRLLRKVDQLEFADPLVVLSLVLLRIERRKRQSVLERMKLSTDQVKAVTLSMDCADLKAFMTGGLAPVKRFKRKPGSDVATEVFRREFAASFPVEEVVVRIESAQLPEAPLLTGQDLIDAGFTPGKEFTPVLREVETCQLDEVITTKEQALGVAKTVMAFVTGKLGVTQE